MTPAELQPVNALDVAFGIDAVTKHVLRGRDLSFPPEERKRRRAKGKAQRAARRVNRGAYRGR